MAKSVRSKFKKANKRIRVADERRNVLKRVTQLNAKLKLVQKGGISKVPSEEPEKRFHFGQPVVNAKQRMTLPEMTTNPYGKSDASAPHPTTFNFEKLPGWMPAGGKSMSFADRDKLEAYQQQLALAAAAAAASEHGNVGAAPSDDDDDGPMEITIGMNDDEHLTTRNFKPAGGNKLKSMTHQKNEHSGAKKMPASGAKKRMVSSTGIKKK